VHKDGAGQCEAAPQRPAILAQGKIMSYVIERQDEPRCHPTPAIASAAESIARLLPRFHLLAPISRNPSTQAKTQEG
jgi:hypothetical protein